MIMTHKSDKHTPVKKYLGLLEYIHELVSDDFEFRMTIADQFCNGKQDVGMIMATLKEIPICTIWNFLDQQLYWKFYAAEIDKRWEYGYKCDQIQQVVDSEFEYAFARIKEMKQCGQFLPLYRSDQ